MHAPRELEAFCRRYIGVCNDHAFERLAEFVADDVEINGEPKGLQGYVEGNEELVRVFPDWRWELRHLLVDGSWIAAHLVDHGTHAETGRPTTTHEFAVYRIAAGKIAEVWGDLNAAALQSAR